MNANTRLRLWKEARALLPVWAALAMLMIAPRLLMDRNPLNLSFPAYWLACALLGAASFSHDFQYRTMGLLLTQPISRRRIWWEKHLILGLGQTGLLLLMLGLWFTDPQTRIDLEHEHWRWILLLEITPLIYAAFIGFTTGPALALLTRTLLGGATLTLACPWMLFLICWLSVPRAHVAYHNSVPALINVTFVGSIYCGLLFLLGCRRFQRLEDVNLLAQEFAAPRQFDSLFSRLTSGLAPGRDSQLANLLRKEVRLQRPAVFVAVFLVALWLAFIVVWQVHPALGAEVLILPSILLGLGIPVIAGIVAVAEERSLGVHEWHLTLPVSARRQWGVKVLVALGVNVAFGILLPGLLAHASSWLADNPQLVAEIPGRNVSPFLIANLVIFCAALYASTASSNSMRALIGAIGLFLAGGLAMNLAVETVHHVGVWAEYGAHNQPGFLNRDAWWPTPEVVQWAYEEFSPVGWVGLAVWLGALGLMNFRRSLEAWRRPARLLMPFFAVSYFFLVFLFTYQTLHSRYYWTYYDELASRQWERQKQEKAKSRAAGDPASELIPRKVAPKPNANPVKARD